MTPLLNAFGDVVGLTIRCTIFILLLVLIPFGLPLLILISYSVRCLVAKIAFAHVGKSLGKLVSTRGVCCAQDNLYEKPQNNIVVSLKFNGNLEIEELRQLVRGRLLQVYTSGAQLKYPELQQHLFSFCGYYFWKDCTNFDLCNHVKELKLPPHNSDQCTKIINEIIQISVNRGWKIEDPLWNMQLINLNKDELVSEHKECILLFTIHHSLGDGYAILGLLRNDLCGDKVANQVQPQTTKRTMTNYLIFNLSFLFTVAWDMSEIVKQCLSYSMWRPQSPEKHQTWNVLSSKFTLAELKLIKTKFGVSLSSVIAAAISGAIRNEIVNENGERLEAINTKSNRMFCMRPRPLPGRGYKLRNFMSESLTRLPINKITPVERLQNSYEMFETSRDGPSELFLSVIFVTIGLLPNRVCHFLLRHMPATVIISNFPGGPDDGFVTTQSGVLRCTNAAFTMGLTVPTIGLGFTILTYGDALSFSVAANQSLYSRKQAEMLLQGIFNELDALLSLVTETRA